jgi:hypothetical protein
MSKKLSKATATRNRKAKPANLPPLTDVQQQVMSSLFTSIALQQHEARLSVEGLAEQFGRTPSRFLPTLRKLADAESHLDFKFFYTPIAHSSFGYA